MEFIGAFVFGGLICLIGQLILDNTKLCPGHVTSIFVVLGSILGFFGVYDVLLNIAHAGANIPITSFGNLLFQAAYEGFQTKGILGIFTNMLSTTSGVISACLIFSFIITLFCKAKD